MCIQIVHLQRLLNLVVPKINFLFLCLSFHLRHIRREHRWVSSEWRSGHSPQGRNQREQVRPVYIYMGFVNTLSLLTSSLSKGKRLIMNAVPINYLALSAWEVLFLGSSAGFTLQLGTLSTEVAGDKSLLAAWCNLLLVEAYSRATLVNLWGDMHKSSTGSRMEMVPCVPDGGSITPLLQQHPSETLLCHIALAHSPCPYIHLHTQSYMTKPPQWQHLHIAHITSNLTCAATFVSSNVGADDGEYFVPNDPFKAFCVMAQNKC